ncbi:MAG: hypothetical protein U0903_17245 [Planctomycetales bacterium]
MTPEIVLPSLKKGDPAGTWNDFFAKERPNPETVRQFVRKLHEAKRYDHVIAALQAAILNGQEQPWMYEVLALTMEVSGYPKEEVERALLSGMDGDPGDYPGTLYLAAYFVRLGRESRALQLYREASRLAPERAEPYLLGLKLARQLKDIDGLEWACTGILKYAWGKDHAQQQKEAAEAAADALKLLKDEGQTARRETFQRTMEEARQRDLQIRLEWSGEGDLDMQIGEPGGSVCSSEQPETPNGGSYLHDGFGPDPKNSYEEYLCRRGKPGDYRILIRKIRGPIVADRATLTILRYQGTPYESKRAIPIIVGNEEQAYNMTLNAGRREPMTVKSAAP